MLNLESNQIRARAVDLFGPLKIAKEAGNMQEYNRIKKEKDELLNKCGVLGDKIGRYLNAFRVNQRILMKYHNQLIPLNDTNVCNYEEYSHLFAHDWSFE